MRTIEIDASNWRTVMDFLTVLRTAVGAPRKHGWSPDAFIDSMIWGGMNRVEPPYEIRVLGSGNAPADVRDYIILVGNLLIKAREERQLMHGIDTKVSLKIVEASSA